MTGSPFDDSHAAPVTAQVVGSPLDSKLMSEDGAKTPPITISHLMILTVCVALMCGHQELWQYLQTAGGLQEGEPGLDGAPAWFVLAARMAAAMLQGGFLAGAFWVLQTKIATGKWFKQPGHCILLLAGIQVPVVVAVYTIYSLQLYWNNGQPRSGFRVWFTVYTHCCTD